MAHLYVPTQTLTAEEWNSAPCVFSTKNGTYRPHTGQSHSIILRNDPLEDSLQLIAKLRREFPDICKKIKLAEYHDIHDVRIQDYFDHKDTQVHGELMLRWTIKEISDQNRRREIKIHSQAQDLTTSHVNLLNFDEKVSKETLRNYGLKDCSDSFLDEISDHVDLLKASRISDANNTLPERAIGGSVSLRSSISGPQPVRRSVSISPPETRSATAFMCPEVLSAAEQLSRPKSSSQVNGSLLPFRAKETFEHRAMSNDSQASTLENAPQASVQFVSAPIKPSNGPYPYSRGHENVGYSSQIHGGLQKKQVHRGQYSTRGRGRHIARLDMYRRSSINSYSGSYPNTPAFMPGNPEQVHGHNSPSIAYHHLYQPQGLPPHMMYAQSPTLVSEMAPHGMISPMGQVMVSHGLGPPGITPQFMVPQGQDAQSINTQGVRRQEMPSFHPNAPMYSSMHGQLASNSHGRDLIGSFSTTDHGSTRKSYHRSGFFTDSGQNGEKRRAPSGRSQGKEVSAVKVAPRKEYTDDVRILGTTACVPAPVREESFRIRRESSGARSNEGRSYGYRQYLEPLDKDTDCNPQASSPHRKFDTPQESHGPRDYVGYSTNIIRDEASVKPYNPRLDPTLNLDLPADQPTVTNTLKEYVQTSPAWRNESPTNSERLTGTYKHARSYPKNRACIDLHKLYITGGTIDDKLFSEWISEKIGCLECIKSKHHRNEYFIEFSDSQRAVRVLDYINGNEHGKGFPRFAGYAHAEDYFHDGIRYVKNPGPHHGSRSYQDPNSIGSSQLSTVNETPSPQKGPRTPNGKSKRAKTIVTESTPQHILTESEGYKKPRKENKHEGQKKARGEKKPQDKKKFRDDKKLHSDHKPQDSKHIGERRIECKLNTQRQERSGSEKGVEATSDTHITRSKSVAKSPNISNGSPSRKPRKRPVSPDQVYPNASDIQGEVLPNKSRAMQTFVEGSQPHLSTIAAISNVEETATCNNDTIKQDSDFPTLAESQERLQPRLKKYQPVTQAQPFHSRKKPAYQRDAPNSPGSASSPEATPPKSQQKTSSLAETSIASNNAKMGAKPMLINSAAEKSDAQPTESHTVLNQMEIEKERGISPKEITKLLGFATAMSQEESPSPSRFLNFEREYTQDSATPAKVNDESLTVYRTTPSCLSGNSQNDSSVSPKISEPEEFGMKGEVSKLNESSVKPLEEEEKKSPQCLRHKIRMSISEPRTTSLERENEEKTSATSTALLPLKDKSCMAEKPRTQTSDNPLLSSQHAMPFNEVTSMTEGTPQKNSTNKPAIAPAAPIPTHKRKKKRNIASFISPMCSGGISTEPSSQSSQALPTGLSTVSVTIPAPADEITDTASLTSSAESVLTVSLVNGISKTCAILTDDFPVTTTADYATSTTDDPAVEAGLIPSKGKGHVTVKAKSKNSSKRKTKLKMRPHKTSDQDVNMAETEASYKGKDPTKKSGSYSLGEQQPEKFLHMVRDDDRKIRVMDLSHSGFQQGDTFEIVPSQGSHPLPINPYINSSSDLSERKSAGLSIVKVEVPDDTTMHVAEHHRNIIWDDRWMIIGLNRENAAKNVLRIGEEDRVPTQGAAAGNVYVPSRSDRTEVVALEIKKYDDKVVPTRLETEANSGSTLSIEKPGSNEAASSLEIAVVRASSSSREEIQEPGNLHSWIKSEHKPLVTETKTQHAMETTSCRPSNNDQHIAIEVQAVNNDTHLDSTDISEKSFTGRQRHEEQYYIATEDSHAIARGTIPIKVNKGEMSSGTSDGYVESLSPVGEGSLFPPLKESGEPKKSTEKSDIFTALVSEATERLIAPDIGRFLSGDEESQIWKELLDITLTSWEADVEEASEVLQELDEAGYREFLEEPFSQAPKLFVHQLYRLQFQETTPSKSSTPLQTIKKFPTIRDVLFDVLAGRNQYRQLLPTNPLMIENQSSELAIGDRTSETEIEDTDLKDISVPFANIRPTKRAELQFSKLEIEARLRHLFCVGDTRLSVVAGLGIIIKYCRPWPLAINETLKSSVESAAVSNTGTLEDGMHDCTVPENNTAYKTGQDVVLSKENFPAIGRLLGVPPRNSSISGSAYADVDTGSLSGHSENDMEKREFALETGIKVSDSNKNLPAVGYIGVEGPDASKVILPPGLKENHPSLQSTQDLKSHSNDGGMMSVNPMENEDLAVTHDYSHRIPAKEDTWGPIMKHDILARLDPPGSFLQLRDSNESRDNWLEDKSRSSRQISANYESLVRDGELGGKFGEDFPALGSSSSAMSFNSGTRRTTYATVAVGNQADTTQTSLVRPNISFPNSAPENVGETTDDEKLRIGEQGPWQSSGKRNTAT